MRQVHFLWPFRELLEDHILMGVDPLRPLFIDKVRKLVEKLDFEGSIRLCPQGQSLVVRISGN